jgi:hypothetical protein
MDLPGSVSYAESAAIADMMNNDDMLDILVGNWSQNSNQLVINSGDGTFHNVPLEYWWKRQK